MDGLRGQTARSTGARAGSKWDSYCASSLDHLGISNNRFVAGAVVGEAHCIAKPYFWLVNKRLARPWARELFSIPPVRLSAFSTKSMRL